MLTSIYFLIVVFIPLFCLLINFLFFTKKQKKGAQIASFGIWLGLILTISAWLFGFPFPKGKAVGGFVANEISWLMATLILSVSASVHQFSLTYMEGDRNYRRYFLLLTAITISTLLMAAADHVVLLLLLWSISNLLLVLLMMHKFQWVAAKNAGILALKTFIVGLVFLSAGIGLLAYTSGTLSLQLIGEKSENLPASTKTLALSLIILAAFSQSGGWPFHRWLISSLNSPTPVSALMHAGLVNGGGLLLARFAPIFLEESLLLNVMFILAVVTLILGGIWKLLQSDVKRMLACSTMTQMGFMLMQCSLGLFPAALAHLCWHGLFKSFLFLKSGSTIAEHRRGIEDRVSTLPEFFISSLCGVTGAYGFMLGNDISMALLDTNAILLFFSWMASTQLAHTLLQRKTSLLSVLATCVICLSAGGIYGLTVNGIEVVLEPLKIYQPQTLNSIHIVGTACIFGIWIVLNLKPFASHARSRWWKRFYVSMLNASQPASNTLSSIKNSYKF